MAKIGEVYVGARFGRLVVSSERLAEIKKPSVKVRCDCGKEKTVNTSNLGRATNSCGCLHREMLSSRVTTHGATSTPEYRSWRAIITRCTNPKNQDWANYGGRGISICDAWRTDFQSFLSSVGPRPSAGHTIDRMDVNGNYEPGNVRWATRGEQASNKRPRRRRPARRLELDRVTAPFTARQVGSLNAFQIALPHQATRCVNPAHDGVRLIAALDGMSCAVTTCEYRQDWAFRVMANWAWKRSQQVKAQVA